MAVVIWRGGGLRTETASPLSALAVRLEVVHTQVLAVAAALRTSQAGQGFRASEDQGIVLGPRSRGISPAPVQPRPGASF